MIRWAAATLVLAAMAACGGGDPMSITCEDAGAPECSTGSTVTPEAAAEMSIAEMLDADRASLGSTTWPAGPCRPG